MLVERLLFFHVVTDCAYKPTNQAIGSQLWLTLDIVPGVTMFSLLSIETAESLRAFLIPVLTEISSNWWSANVIPALSFQQQRMVEEKGVANLSGLDLAALLRILDKNWYDISAKCRLDNETRTWTREMQHT